MKLEVLQLLKEQLNGKCSKQLRTCPKHIYNDKFNIYDTRWCFWFQDNFSWLHQGDITSGDTCPCYLQTENNAVIQHLNDIIKQLEGKA